ncbi:DUF4915 domain-containing protein [Burkholderia sp. Ax-1719]|uniref:DUF4915 domain-containing protein n=1 Tax=Burkholderia sp. Ax-1719 TaxID=2608334 RepID=UPI0023D9808C|nr:DUF4915 domain-containing protein [Burkholderia sp. Ax-1719]NIE66106.1 DUF4915 domain-containing protein [Burkholderia sp. Ax-1719]
MAHQNQIDYCLSVKKRFPSFFSRTLVLDIGSLDINGNNRYLFDDCRYLGLDVLPGKNVDIVSKGHELSMPDSTFDTIVSTEALEHDLYYPETIKNAVRLLKPGGLLLLTCATTGRPEHGTAKTTPHDAPLLQGDPVWSTYYKNLTAADIAEVLDLDSVFSEYEFDVNTQTHDLYFFGVKRHGTAAYIVDTKGESSGMQSASDALAAMPDGAIAQNCKTRSRRGGLIISSPNENGGLFVLKNDRVIVLDRSPTAGIMATGDCFLRALQPYSLVLHRQDRIEITRQDFDDIHDVLQHDEFIYVVGTIKNQITKLDVNGHEIKRWVYPGEDDSRHINCLGVWNGRVVFSAFGDFDKTRGYKSQTSGRGYVEDLESGDRVIEGLDQPHSLVQFGDNLLVANSGQNELCEYSPQGKLLRSKQFESYVRGVAVADGRIFVGLSRSRNPEEATIASAMVLELDALHWHVVDRNALPSNEIYTLFHVADEAELSAIIADTLQIATTQYERERSDLRKWLNERDGHFAAAVKALYELDSELCLKHFDASWYTDQYPVATQSGLSPEVHYFSNGGVEDGRLPMRDPYLFFDRVLADFRAKKDQLIHLANSQTDAIQHTLVERDLSSASALATALRKTTELEEDLRLTQVAAERATSESIEATARRTEAHLEQLAAREREFAETLRNLHSASAQRERESRFQHAERDALHASQLADSRMQVEQAMLTLHQQENANSERLLKMSDRYQQEKLLLNREALEREEDLRSEMRELRDQLQLASARKVELEFEKCNAIAKSTNEGRTQLHALELALHQERSNSETKLSRQINEALEREHSLKEQIRIAQSQAQHFMAQLTAFQQQRNEIAIHLQEGLTPLLRLSPLRIGATRLRRLRSVLDSVHRILLNHSEPAVFTLNDILATADLSAASTQAPVAAIQINKSTRLMPTTPTLTLVGEPASSVADLLARNDESFIQCAYETLLRRLPDEQGTHYYLTRLRAGVSKRVIIAQLAISKEGQARAVDLPGLGEIVRRYRYRNIPFVGKWLHHDRDQVQSIRAIEAQLQFMHHALNTRLSEIDRKLHLLAGSESTSDSEMHKLELVAPATTSAPVFDMRPASGAPIVILTVKHCLYIAHAIQASLARADIQSEIILARPPGGYEDVPHIVICPQIFDTLPGFYVAFQMEQSVSSRWFTPEYFKILENSYAVFDYSLENIAFLQDNGLSRRQTFYLPVGYIKDYAPESQIDAPEYDVLFYGDVNCDRRQQYLTEIQKHYRVKIINDTFGTDLHSEMANAKVVINVHYYPGALLETTRIYECLSLHKLVVSERSSDMKRHEELEDIVDFVEIDDIQAMLDKIRYWVEDDARRDAKIQSNRHKLESMSNSFDYFLYRFLLATDNIKFDDFWELAGHKLELQSERLCLTLPEDTVRGDDFQASGSNGFMMFPGLRHMQGWIGCALSYKYMISLARQKGMRSITICEDDVDFPEDFSNQWENIKNHLDSNFEKWDIFSGLLANLSEEASVLEESIQSNQQYVVVDKLISTVFNCYNKRIFDLIANWDPDNRDVHTNTIDRYLERKRSMRVMTTHPFLVGHKEDHTSTIWGFKNTQYLDLIAASSELLGKKLGEFQDRSKSSVFQRFLGGKRRIA